MLHKKCLLMHITVILFSFQNKVFVFRGNEFEKLPDFNARLSVTHPQAKVCVY